MKSINTETKLGMSELPTGSAIVPEPVGPAVLGNTSESRLTEFPRSKHKCTQKENRMLRMCCFESNKNVKGYMERMHWFRLREDVGI